MATAKETADAEARKSIAALILVPGMEPIMRELLDYKSTADAQALREEDRRQLFAELAPYVTTAKTALDEAPHRVAVDGVAALENILSTVTDPIGPFQGNCEHCGEPIFENDSVVNIFEDGEGPDMHTACGDIVAAEWKKSEEKEGNRS